MLLPILYYRFEILGCNNSPGIEHVNLKFLGVKQQTCSTAVYGEYGVFPLCLDRRIITITFWYKFIN
jgi:uncharacterized lipoprotein NlpE involved in copper resistance